jgi:adenosylmethionine-8-amino-7-oxononanoate aminotransferase
MEAAMKLARQYFLELSPQSPRSRFIAREGSWHGSTLATLAIGDFKVRKCLFEPLLADNVSRVSACHPYRGLKEGENSEEYVARLAQELEDEFQRVGPENVCAFIAEPIVGTVSCSPSSFVTYLNQTSPGSRLCCTCSGLFPGHKGCLRPSWRPSDF